LFPLLVLVGCWSAAHAQDVVLVANRGVSISEITSADVRAIFTGARTRLADGSRAVPVTLKGGATHEVFLKNHLDTTPGDFRAQWRKAVFTGQGSMLKAFDSESALVDYVAATPGAIGYVSRLLPQEREKVKSLVVVR
jgi:ABC-type phosphate transport system substrate-binding protein